MQTRRSQKLAQTSWAHRRFQRSFKKPHTQSLTLFKEPYEGVGVPRAPAWPHPGDLPAPLRADPFFLFWSFDLSVSFMALLSDRSFSPHYSCQAVLKVRGRHGGGGGVEGGEGEWRECLHCELLAPLLLRLFVSILRTLHLYSHTLTVLSPSSWNTDVTDGMGKHTPTCTPNTAELFIVIRQNGC